MVADAEVLCAPSMSHCLLPPPQPTLPPQIIGKCLESLLDFTGEEYGHLDSLKICHNPNGGIFITFNYRDKEYIRYPIVNREKLLLPDTQQRINLSDNIFLGTDIKHPGGSVYYKEVIECLPTLQVKYMSKSGAIYSSRGIKNVKYKGKPMK